MSKHKILFDTTDANTIEDSDSLGAYLRSSDGTLLTHTTVGGKEALDVRVAEGINVEVDLDFADDSVDVSGSQVGITGDVNVTQGTDPWVVSATDLDIRDLDASQDNVAISDGTDTLEVNADGSLNAVVSATDLDIRDLTFAQDKVDVSGSQVGVTGDVNVTATDLDIRDLDAATDSVQAWAHDGAGTALTSTLVGSDQALDVNVVAAVDGSVSDTAIASAVNSLDVANTAEDVVASPLANRKLLFIYNNGNRTAYIGASGVSAANGFPLPPGSILELKAGPSVDIEWVGPNTDQELRTLELS